MSAATADHLVPLGRGWEIWRHCAVRSAGFPADVALRLAGPDLTEWAGRTPSAEFDQAYLTARTREEAALVRAASDSRFLTAVTWQNHAVVRTWLRKLPAVDPNAHGVRRDHVHVLTSYLQRYCLKNDTVGYFGPVGWARWTDDRPALSVHPGDGLLAESTVYFETWAIDALAEALADDLLIRPWLTPRVVASCRLVGSTVERPHGPPVELTEWVRQVIVLCDGGATVTAIADRLACSPSRLLDELDRLRDKGILELGLAGPIEPFPERTLSARLDAIGDRAARKSAHARLTELVAARDRVAAADHPDALLAALSNLDQVFTRITGADPTRRAGQMYAGRTLVYTDSRRAVDVELGACLRERIAPPLTMLLDSARWLLGRIAECYDEVFLRLFERCQDDDGTAPFARLLSAATPHLFVRARPLEPIARAMAEFQRKWADILKIPAGVRAYEVRSADIADAVAREFPTKPLRWSAARHCSPDLMLAASDVDAVNRGEGLVVLGELHLAVNSIESRLFVQQHEDPAQLLAAASADHRARRVFAVPPKEWPNVNSRTYPPALLSGDFTYWCLHDDSSGAPGPVLPAAGMTVRRVGDRLSVRLGPGGSEADLLEVIGEQLSFAAVNAFAPIAPAPHQPRVTVDDLVVHRETWRFDAPELGWARRKTAAERYRLAQEWRRHNRIARRAFYRTASERKPLFVDFTSIVLCERLAKAVRAAAASAPGQEWLSLSEMVPDGDNLWLTDREGARYTSELRMVAVAPDE